MKILSFLIVLSVAISVHAEYLPYVASDKEIRILKSKILITGSSYSDNTYATTVSFYQKNRNLTIQQLFAEALTNTLIRIWTARIRSKNVSGNTEIRKRSRKGNLVLEYSAEIKNNKVIREKYDLRLLNDYNRTLIFWHTTSLQISPYRISTSEIKTILKKLHQHGFELADISIAVKNQTKYTNAVSFLREVGIIDKALIGIDRTAKFAKIRISIKKNK